MNYTQNELESHQEFIMKMIVASEKELHVGQITSDLRDYRGIAFPYQIFKVVRRSNAREYLEYNRRAGADMEMAFFAITFFHLYYEIQTD